MGKITKVLLFFVVLVDLALSVCILSLYYPIPYIQDTVNNYLAAYPWLNYIVTGFIAFVCLCFLILLLVILFFPGKTNFLVVKKDKGKLQFSKKTIESTVRYSFADLKEIASSKIRVKVHKKPGKTKIFVNLSINDSTRLAALTETVQERIAAALRSSLDVDVKSILVKVLDYKTSGETVAQPSDLATFEAADKKTGEAEATVEAPNVIGDDETTAVHIGS